jgi:general secretion pathway protein F
VAHGLRDYGPIALLIVVAAAFGLRPLLRRPDMQRRIDGATLRLPGIGPLIAKIETAQFCNMLGVLLVNGVPGAAALGIAGDGFGNKLFHDAARRMVDRVREGQSLSRAIGEENLLPSLALQMIRLGEEAGQLDAMLLRTANMYDREVRQQIERFLTLLTPLTTIILVLSSRRLSRPFYPLFLASMIS